MIFTSDPRERLRHRPASDRNGGRLRLGTTAGFKSESPAGFVGIRNLDRRIEALDRDFVARARADEAARRLVSIPGVGPMTATALRAAVDDGSAFASARDLPAWLGLVPRQHTTGGKPKLLGISKRGNAYLRRLFVHGARAALASLSKIEDATGRWLRGLLARAHYNVVVVALAAKLAQIAWATLRRGMSFERRPEPALA